MTMSTESNPCHKYETAMGAINALSPVKWHGHHIVSSNYPDSSVLLYRGTLSTLGIAAITVAHPIIGLGLIALSTPHNTFSYYVWGNPLEKAMLEIAGGKENVDKLPIVSWKKDSGVIRVEPETVTAPIMRGLDEKGCLVFILYKIKNNTNYVKEASTFVKIFCFGERCEETFTWMKTHQMLIDCKMQMYGREGVELEDLIKKSKDNEHKELVLRFF